MHRRCLWVVVAWQLLFPLTAQSQVNYDESQVPDYELPPLLQFEDGTPVRTAGEWELRAKEIRELFAAQVYGRMPGRPEGMKFRAVSEGEALGGLAIRKEVDVLLTGADDGPSFRILLYLPAGAERRPVFLGLNFGGNHTVTDDPAVSLSTRWMRPGPGVEDHRATEASRGSSASRWPLKTILQRGYAVATVYYGDIDPDFDDGFQNGVHPLSYEPGQTKPAPDQWGSIGAWAWGLSRAADYLATDPRIDAGRIAVLGHSRLGKTSLWAGATDSRFAIVISNNSGCGGAALSRREFGETVKRINTSFPHWFCDNFVQYNDRVQDLPVDQHMLLALIAPRPVYVASASEDLWADPRGEFFSAREASVVYRLLGRPALAADQAPPQPGESLTSTVGYHLREGKHDVTEFDWRHYLDFADHHWRRAEGKREATDAK